MLKELLKYVYFYICMLSEKIEKLNKRKIFKNKNKINFCEYELYYYCSLFQILMNLRNLEHLETFPIKVIASSKKIAIKAKGGAMDLFNNNFSVDKLLEVAPGIMETIFKEDQEDV